jgi:hypothetical protein
MTNPICHGEDRKMNRKQNKGSAGIGVVGLLGVVFVTLKLAGVIDWSWWWVTLPFWGSFALFVAIVIAAGIFVAKRGTMR